MPGDVADRAKCLTADLKDAKALLEELHARPVLGEQR
jgi:hypothetical protein